MEILISNSSEKPIYEQIKIQLKNKILAGEIEEGSMLPSIRVLAKDLRVSVITTKRVYDDLEKDGFIETIAGKGSVVAFRNKSLVKEEQLSQIEVHLQRAIDMAKINKISKEELLEMLRFLYEEED